MSELTQEEKNLLGSAITNELFIAVSLVAKHNKLSPVEMTPYVEALAKWFVENKSFLEAVKLAMSKSST